MNWDPALYLKFERQRLQPARDLIARIPEIAPAHIVDLGCGTGAATALLADRFAQADITAIDSSPDMLAGARAGDRDPRIRLERCDIAAWQPDRAVDLIFSNAALHWLDDHQTLLPRLAGYLAPGGVLAVQMPGNFEAPSHRAIAETVAAGPWAARLGPLFRPNPVAPAGKYFDLLAPLCAEVEIWRTDYLHRLGGDNPVADWTRATALQPLLGALETSERAAFLADYRRRVAAAYPRRADGTTLFAFRRLFIIATK